MKLYSTLFKRAIRFLIIIIIVGIIASNLIDYTFSASINLEPNITITINNNGNSTINGNLFNGYLYPSSQEDAEKGLGSIRGVIRINNQFNKIDVNTLAIGINNLKKSNGTLVSNEVFDSFINNVNLKVNKGVLFNFDKTILEYTKLKDILYIEDNEQYQGYLLSSNDKFSIDKGHSVDLKYTLQMSPEAGNELQSIIAQMPIYINLEGTHVIEEDEDDDDDEEIVIIEDNEIPVAELNKEDHFQYIQGYPDNTVRPEGLVTREEVAAVFYRLLESNYRMSILTENEDFPDVNFDRWSTKHIATLSNGNIIEGYPDGSFKPENPITRAELATIASKFDKLSAYLNNSFSDIDGHWAIEYINSAAAKGWVEGYPDGTFKPDQYITRAEFVTLVNNVLGRGIHKENILKEARVFPDLSDTMWYYEAMQEAINSHLYIRNEDMSELWIEIIYPKLDL
ncbi:MAG: S-layer homology domain-containing protein [Sedimentibacter sp.]|uniref:S-layer homology domain-containing protein n=1 Tax=Sedimentibacter sp. TaxID=1960295 RepID=UPI00298136AA|nr:S-layer homology domain-containing protein [Sedimentibacter sp.]MDW5299933.1 S-layer homology domain-containing protein [Sedimentibacter sp.]